MNTFKKFVSFSLSFAYFTPIEIGVISIKIDLFGLIFDNAYVAPILIE